MSYLDTSSTSKASQTEVSAMGRWRGKGGEREREKCGESMQADGTDKKGRTIVRFR